MSKKQLLLFSLVMIIMVGNGGGIATVLPIYLKQLGADSSKIGLLFSVLYLGLSSAGILAGWLSDRLQKRKWLCVASAAGIIVSAIVQLTSKSLIPLCIAMFFAWFLAGIHSALVYTLVGLQAEAKERGQVFGLMGFVIGFGPIISGFLYGPIVDRYGFPFLLTINVGLSVLWLVLSLFYQEPSEPAQVAHMSQQNEQETSRQNTVGTGFILIVIASILGWISINGGRLGTTIVMDGLGFSAGDISFTTGVASVVVLTMPLLLGWLSDRIGRKPIILALNVLGIAGLLILNAWQTLPGFYLAVTLLTLYGCFGGLANALTTDLIPRGSLGLGMALMSGSSNIAGIFSSTLFGAALSTLGVHNTFLAALILPVTAALLFTRIPEARQLQNKNSRLDPAVLPDD